MAGQPLSPQAAEEARKRNAATTSKGATQLNPFQQPAQPVDYMNIGQTTADGQGKRVGGDPADWAKNFMSGVAGQFNTAFGPKQPAAGTNPQSTQQPFSQYDMDMTAPGYGEQAWEYNKDRWQSSPGMDWINKNLGKLDDPTYGENFGRELASTFGPGSSAFNGANGGMNTKYSVQPTFDAAYDRAMDKGLAKFNSQAASRGAYGSSVALNNVGGLISDIEAQRADRAGDFALKDQENQRSWLNSLSGLGSNLVGQELGRVGTAGGLAFNADSAQMNRLLGHQQAATSAQNSRENRLNDIFGNMSGYTNNVGNYFNQAYDALIKGDNASVDQLYEAYLASTGNAAGAEQMSKQEFITAAKMAKDVYTTFSGGGGAPTPGSSAFGSGVSSSGTAGPY